MKKTYTLLLMLLSMVTLAGCQEDDVVVPTPDVNSFSFELVDLNGEKLIEETISFEEGSSESTLDLIETVVDVDYDTFDFGIMINGIDGHYPKEFGASYNYYYQILVDDVASTVGISEIEYVDGMKISFVEVSTLSEFDLMVDTFIYDFIENNLDGYLSDDYVDYMVLSSIYQLDMKNYIDFDFDAYYTYENLDLSNQVISEMSLSELLKAGPVYKLENMNLDDYKNALKALDVSNPYSATSYLEALYMAGEKDEVVAQTLMSEVVADPDLAGMSLKALEPYSDLEGYATYLETLTDYIKTTLTATGIESWGSSNSASTATVMLGLVAQGINPQGEAYLTDGIGLVESLMLYVDGYNFKWQLESAEADLAFSTPQAFSALVAYKLSRDVWGLLQ